MGGGQIDPATRVAWLLATSRLLAPATRGIGRTEFVRRMAHHDISLDPSRMSRVESGTKRAHHRMLSAYESVVEAPSGSMLALSAQLYRSRAAAGVQPPGNDAAVGSSEALDETFALIESREASGSHWLQLAHELTSYDRVYLHPAARESLAGQLVSEITRSSGVASLRRYAAASLFMERSRASRLMSLSVGRFVMDSDAQNVVPALNLLGEVGDEAAGRLVLRLMRGDNPLLSRGATSVAGSFQGRDSLAQERQMALETHLAQELRKPGSPMKRLDALEIATGLPDEGFERLLSVVTDTRVRQAMLRARSDHELVSHDDARSCVEAIATYAEAMAQRAAHDPDQMLRRLIRESLFHAHRERRNLAASTIAISPYAGPVADAVLKLVHDDQTLATMSWSMLRRFGHVLERERVSQVALTETREGLRARGLVTLGLVQGPLESACADRLLAQALDAPSPSLEHAAVFALGMSGHSHLETLAVKGSPRQQRAAAWWRKVGPAIHDGVTRESSTSLR